jgi:hypothetical protein
MNKYLMDGELYSPNEADGRIWNKRRVSISLLITKGRDFFPRLFAPGHVIIERNNQEYVKKPVFISLQALLHVKKYFHMRSVSW